LKTRKLYSLGGTPVLAGWITRLLEGFVRRCLAMNYIGPNHKPSGYDEKARLLIAEVRWSSWYRANQHNGATVHVRCDLRRTDVLGPTNDLRDLLIELHATGFGFVQNEAFKWIDVARPRRSGQHLRHVRVARVPTEPNSAGTEVDIL